jgi:Mg-chelatase subunit ChlD
MNPYNLSIVANSLAGRYGITINFVEDQDAVPTMSASKVLTIKQPLMTYDNDDWINWLGQFYHEVGHWAVELEDSMEWIKENGNDVNTPFGMCLNFAVDYRNEYNKYSEYAGKLDVLNKSRVNYYKKVNKLPFLSSESGENQMIDIFRVLIGLDGLARIKWMPSIEAGAEQFVNKLPEDLQEKVAKCIELGYDKRLQYEITGIEDEVKLCHDILKNIFELDPEEEQDKSTTTSEKDGEDGEDDKEGDGDASINDTKPSGSGEIDWRDVLPDAHDTTKLEPRDVTLHINYTDIGDKADYVPYTADEVVLVDIPNKRLHAGKGVRSSMASLLRDEYYFSPRSPNSSLKRAIDNAMNSTGLSRKIERLLQIASRDIYRSGKKKGRLCAKNLYRATMKDSGGFAQRVMKTKEDKLSLKETKIFLLIDQSGSMGTHKTICAAHATMHLSEVLSLIGVDHEIGGFTEEDCLVHTIIKPMGVRMSLEKLSHNLAVSAAMMAGNADGDSLLYAANRFAKHKAQRKIMIVLSDGSPAGGKGYDIEALDTYTRKAIASIEDDSDMELIGIGIEDDNAERLYTNSMTIKKASELEAKLLNLIKRTLING